MNWYKQAQKDPSSANYPIAGETVSGLQVRDEVPNLSSIGATLYDYEILDGIREVPISDFGGPRTVFYAANDFDRSKSLAEEIKVSGEIKPLIIIVDDEGPYILEGAHRFVALYYLGVPTFPALVVLDQDGKNELV